eukprot:1130616-Rhodomonas_salina.1
MASAAAWYQDIPKSVPKLSSQYTWHAKCSFVSLISQSSRPVPHIAQQTRSSTFTRRAGRYHGSLGPDHALMQPHEASAPPPNRSITKDRSITTINRSACSINGGRPGR